MIRVGVAALLLLLVPVAGCKSSSSPGSEAAAPLDVVPLSITTAGGQSVRLRVEVARSFEQQARGLMFRKSLADDAGMLFPYKAPQPVSFWMKDTLIPLDMIFIRADGVIARIEAETEPYSLERVKSGEPVAAVLEIAGGRATALGISEGDRAAW